ncbi:MAG: RNA polymerase sigma factor [Endomicrobia bacterium]|nr:RNA polymerase sigma factor [Endomicrobiia bacterium]
MKDKEIEVSDFEIIYDILNGNKEKFGIIIKRYQSYIFSIILRLVGNLEDAKDLAQEIFIKIYYCLPQYNIKHNFKSWIYKIAVNYVLDFMRKKNSKKNFENNFIVVDLSELEHLCSSRTDEKFTEFELKEEAQKILSIIYKLKPKYKEVMLLRYIEGLTVDEISDILKISCHNVKVRLYRAIKIIKNFLKFL